MPNPDLPKVTQDFFLIFRGCVEIRSRLGGCRVECGDVGARPPAERRSGRRCGTNY